MAVVAYLVVTVTQLADLQSRDHASLETSGDETADIDPRNCGRTGGMPCLERWKAFIFASMLCGIPPLALACGAGGPLGLRALFNMPIGVEEEVIEDEVGRSEMERREGT